MPTLNAGDSPGAGSYTCASCSSRVTLAAGETLPTCSSCGGTSWLPGGGRASVKDPKPVGSI
jgi:Zinc-ribbon containing domain